MVNLGVCPGHDQLKQLDYVYADCYHRLHLVGSLSILMGLVFSVFGFIGGNILRGVTGAFGAVLGAGIIGWGPSWVSSLTGQTVGP